MCYVDVCGLQKITVVNEEEGQGPLGGGAIAPKEKKNVRIIRNPLVHLQRMSAW